MTIDFLCMTNTVAPLLRIILCSNGHALTAGMPQSPSLSPDSPKNQMSGVSGSFSMKSSPTVI